LDDEEEIDGWGVNGVVVGAGVVLGVVGYAMMN